MKTSLYQKCIDEERFSLLAEWDANKNDPLTPWTVSTGSHKRVWWKCAQGHEWQAAVFTRWAGHGCPVCSGRKVLPGVNDLASRYPALAAEWHPKKNGALRPEAVPANSARCVWWCCEKGHEWQATVNDRAKGSGCPVCASRSLLAGYNDLAATNPELVSEWHPTKNGTLTPERVFPGSARRVWWRCAEGHEWQAAISSRAKGGCGCPVCAGKKLQPGVNDLGTLAPETAAQWHPTKNGALTPERVRPQSARLVWWRCEKGHEWQATVASRVKGKSGCPVCANRTVLPGVNDLMTAAPKLAAEWHPTKNGALTPEQVGAGSHRRVWWQCEKGHEWRAQISARSSTGSGCPVCAGRSVKPGENDLASFSPALAAEWHPTRNGALTPDQLRPQSNRAVWWCCALGHEWKAVVNARVQSGSGCPYCANRTVLAGFNDLATTDPQLADQWSWELNGALTPQMLMAGSHRKVWWRCKDGHLWRAAVYSRTGTQRSGCPVCAGVVGKKRLERMRLLEEEARAGLSRQRLIPERYVPQSARLTAVP